MNYLLRNLTRRPVSIACNSGAYCHLPPKHDLIVDGFEIENNAMVAKLIERGVLFKVAETVAAGVVAAAGLREPITTDSVAKPISTRKRSGAGD